MTRHVHDDMTARCPTMPPDFKINPPTTKAIVAPPVNFSCNFFRNIFHESSIDVR